MGVRDERAGGRIAALTRRQTRFRTILYSVTVRVVTQRTGLARLLASVLIGVFVLYSACDPLSRWFIPMANAVGRTMFAGVILYYVMVHDIARIVLLIGIVDVFISGAFVYCLVALRSSLNLGNRPPNATL
jgi:hypothetical protein